MNKNDTEIVVAVLAQMLLYGPQAVLATMASLDKKEWTADEIRVLKIDKTPEEYFDE